MNKTAFVFEDTYFDLEAIKAILNKIDEITFLDSASTTVSEARAKCLRLKPDLIIVDSEIHGEKKAGPSFIYQIKKELPDVKVLGMTRYADCIELLKQAGCDFVVNKSLIENDEAAVKFIRESFIPKPMFFYDKKPPKLNEQEDKILRLICKGLTEEAIAEEMGIEGRKPVRSVKNMLFSKFGATNVANLVHHAYQSGYLRPED